MLDILIISDDRKVRQALKAYLSLKDDVRICVEKDGRRGLKRIFQHNFDYVLVNLHRGTVKNSSLADPPAQQCSQTNLTVLRDSECPYVIGTMLADLGWTYLEKAESVSSVASAMTQAAKGEHRWFVVSKVSVGNRTCDREKEFDTATLTQQSRHQTGVHR